MYPKLHISHTVADTYILCFNQYEQDIKVPNCVQALVNMENDVYCVVKSTVGGPKIYYLFYTQCSQKTQRMLTTNKNTCSLPKMITPTQRVGTLNLDLEVIVKAYQDVCMFVYPS